MRLKFAPKAGIIANFWVTLQAGYRGDVARCHLYGVIESPIFYSGPNQAAEYRLPQPAI